MPKDLSKILDEYERKLIKQRIRIKRSEDRDAFQRVFDNRTILLLTKLLNKGVIYEIVGIISQGKEANVYFAYDRKDRPLAVKIYKIDPQSARWMKRYIQGDPRFKKIGNTPDKIIFTWCRKEYKNLTVLHRNGINCPEPIFNRANILIMSYIGDEDGTPAPKLKDIQNELEDPATELEVTIGLIDQMYNKAKIVHGDLSEFNILYYNNRQYVIDVSQAVSKFHPKAIFYLSRDIKNCLNFYRRFKIPVPSADEVYENIVLREE